MVITVILSGIPHYVTLADLARSLDQLFNTDEIGTFRVRSLPNHARTNRRQVGLVFKNGFEAITAQNLLDNYSYSLADGEEHILRARLTSNVERQPNRSPSQHRAGMSGPGQEMLQYNEGWGTVSLTPMTSSEELHKINAKLDVEQDHMLQYLTKYRSMSLAHLEVLMKQKKIVDFERELIRSEKKLAKEYKRQHISSDSDSDVDRARSASPSPRRTPSHSNKRPRRETKRSPLRSRDRRRSRSKNKPSSSMSKAEGDSRDYEMISVQRKPLATCYDKPSCSKRKDGVDSSKSLLDIIDFELSAKKDKATQYIVTEMESLLKKLDCKSPSKVTEQDGKTILKQLKCVVKSRVNNLNVNRHTTVSQIVSHYRCRYSKSDDVTIVKKLLAEMIELSKDFCLGESVVTDKVWSDLGSVLQDISDDTFKPEQTEIESSKPNAEESDGSQNETETVNVFVKIVSKPKQPLPPKINFGHNDKPVMKPDDSIESKDSGTGVAADDKSKHKGVLIFKKKSKMDPDWQRLIFFGPRTISPNPKFVLPVKHLIKEMKAIILKTDDRIECDKFISLLKRDIRHKIRGLLKGKDYMTSKDIKSLFRQYYPRERDEQLIAELQSDILAGKYEGVVESDEDREDETADGSVTKCADKVKVTTENFHTCDKTDVNLDPENVKIQLADVKTQLADVKMEPADVREEYDTDVQQNQVIISDSGNVNKSSDIKTTSENVRDCEKTDVNIGLGNVKNQLTNVKMVPAHVKVEPADDKMKPADVKIEPA